MANVYAIRVHELDITSASRVRSFCESTGGSYVVARETDASRVHYQGWIRCDIKSQALRARLKKAFPECVGNKGYSLTAVKDFEKYSRYILKGTPEELAVVIAYYGIELNEETLASEHRAYWSTHSKPGKSNRGIVEEVEEWVKSQEWTDDRNKLYEVAERVCDTITARKRSLPLYYVRGVVNTLMYRNDANTRKEFLREVISKF